MALAPCAFDGRRFQGPSSRAYITILDGADKWETKPRLCVDHCDEIVQMFEMVNGRVSPDSAWAYQDAPCLVCGGSTDGGASLVVFATIYPRDGFRADFFATVHPDCRAEAQDRFLGPSGDQQLG